MLTGYSISEYMFGYFQAHEGPVRSMVWSRSDTWLVTGDANGHIKYWQTNMNNVKSFQAHRDSIRGITFCPTDFKFATGSDDGTIRIWDFDTCETIKVLKGKVHDLTRKKILLETFKFPYCSDRWPRR